MKKDETRGDASSRTHDRFIREFACEGKRKPGTVAQWRQVELSFCHSYRRTSRSRTSHEVMQQSTSRSSKRAPQVFDHRKKRAIVKQIFAWAVDWELSYPTHRLTRLKAPAAIPKNNVEVPRSTIETILSVVDPEWQKIEALARYGGLRTPSETLSIRWDQINFETGRMIVPRMQG